MNSLCIITARGGSKRIPRKNIKPFCGKPIISYSIAAALESGIFNEVMVSTDDAEIANVAREYGAAVPFMRDAETSNDFATTDDVLREVLGKYKSIGSLPDWFCCVYPTAPFITAGELCGAKQLLVEKNAPAVYSVTTFDFPPQRGFVLDVDGSIGYAYPEFAQKRSQDIPVMLHDCGRFYFYRTSDFLTMEGAMPVGTLPYVISPEIVQDIDTLDDWAQAEFKFRYMRERANAKR